MIYSLISLEKEMRLINVIQRFQRPVLYIYEIGQ